MKNFEDKNSPWFKYYSNDFSIHRKLQFFSAFYQAKEAIINPEIKTMLEFGTGRNLTKAIVEHYGISHKSVDFDNKKYIPDEVSTIMDFKDNKKYDIVAAFQVLEHNPLSTLEQHLLKMKSLTKKYIYISVPYSGRWFSLSFNFNFFPKFAFKKSININWQRILKKTRPTELYKKRKDKYNPHWWEVGDKDFTKSDFKKLIYSMDMKIEKSFHNEFFPYHLFYLIKKNTI